MTSDDDDERWATVMRVRVRVSCVQMTDDERCARAMTGARDDEGDGTVMRRDDQR